MINKKNKDIIYSEIVKKFGVELQLDMVVEECSELIQSIQKIKRYGCCKYIEDLKSHDIKNDEFFINLFKEISDVEIMLEQLRYMLKTNVIDVNKTKTIRKLNKNY